MSDITPGSILDRVVQELPNFFRDGVDQLVTGEGEYIRAGEPQGTVGKVGQAIARSYCRQYGANPGAAKFGNAARIENACRPYLDDQDPGKGAEIGVPFPGGQCADLYRAVGAVRFDRLVCSTGQAFETVMDFATEFNLQGPLSASRIVRGEPGQCGDRLFAVVITTATQPNRVIFTTTDVFQRAIINPAITSLSFERQGALPDDCGDPPPVVRQPRPIADPSPPPFRFNPDGGIDINVDVDVLPDGTINIGVGGPTVNVDPFGGGDGGGGGAPPVGPGTSGGSGDTGLGGVDEGSADEGDELVGVLVQVLSAPLDANRFFNNAAVVYRGAYYVAMGYPGRLGLDMSGGTAEILQFFHAQQRGLTDYRVRANVGFNLRVTPYYRTVEE